MNVSFFFFTFPASDLNDILKLELWDFWVIVKIKIPLEQKQQ